MKCFYFFNSFMTEVPIIPISSRANQWTGFYIIGTSVMKELKNEEGRVDQ